MDISFYQNKVIAGFSHMLIHLHEISRLSNGNVYVSKYVPSLETIIKWKYVHVAGIYILLGKQKGNYFMSDKWVEFAAAKDKYLLKTWHDLNCIG